MFRDLLSAIYDDLQDNYIFPAFSISIAPCGDINAFSRPDIAICSELVNDLIGKGQMDALFPIMHHELAHTLLYLWGDPRASDEDTADELGLVFTRIMSDQPRATTQMYKLADWFSSL